MEYMLCHQDKMHEDEKLELICLNKECILNQKILNCVVCIEEYHQGHSLISLRKFLSLYKEKEEEFRVLANQILQDENEQQQYEQQKRQYADLVIEIDQLKAKMNSYLEDLKRKINQSKETLELLNSTIPSQFFIKKCIKQNNLKLCQQILKKILLSVSYDTHRQQLAVRSNKIFDPNQDTNDLYQNQRNIKIVLDNLESILQQNTFAQTGFSKQISRNVSAANLNPSASQGLLLSNFNLNKLTLAQSTTNFMDAIREQSPDELTYSASPLYSLSQFYSKTNTKWLIPNSANQKPDEGDLIGNYSFYEDFMGKGIKLMKNGKMIKMVQQFERQLILIKPAIFGNGVMKETSVKLKIKKCNNFNQRYPLAVGIINMDKAKYYNFNFNGVADHLSGEKYQEHGTYLLNANGMVRSVIKNLDLIPSSPNLRFNTDSVLELKFKPFHKQLVVVRDDSHETTLELTLKDGERLYFGIRMSDLSDQVEII